MSINIVALLKKCNSTIVEKDNILENMEEENINSVMKEKSLQLDKYPNFKRHGNIVINMNLFKSMKNDISEYFNNPQNFYNLNSDSDFDRLKKNLYSYDRESKDNLFSHENSKSKSITELQGKHPDLYHKYQLSEFKQKSYILQGEILSELSTSLSSLSEIYPYLDISKSAASKRIKAYKLSTFFPEEQKLLGSLSCRVIEAFPSDYKLQKEILTHLKNDPTAKITREYVLKIRKIIEFDDDENRLNLELENLSKILNDNKFNSLSTSDKNRVFNYLDKINSIMKKNYILN